MDGWMDGWMDLEPSLGRLPCLMSLLPGDSQIFLFWVIFGSLGGKYNILPGYPIRTTSESLVCYGLLIGGRPQRCGFCVGATSRQNPGIL